MRKNFLTIIALVAVFALALTGCGGNKAAETTAATEAAVSQPLGLSDWSMTAATWSSPNGATINLAATPYDYEEGQTAAFIVRLEGEEVANVACEWNGSQYTASAELNAADGYCYYVLMTAADGNTAEVAVNTPTEPTDEAFINMESSLNSYCSLVVEESAFEGSNLTISNGTIQVQAPKITNEGETITCQEAVLTLSFNGEELDSETLALEAAEAAGLYELTLSGVTFDIPAMEDDQQLDLALTVTLSNGQILNAHGGTWFYNNEGLLPVVG